MASSRAIFLAAASPPSATILNSQAASNVTCWSFKAWDSPFESGMGWMVNLQRRIVTGEVDGPADQPARGWLVTVGFDSWYVITVNALRTIA